MAAQAPRAAMAAENRGRDSEQAEKRGEDREEGTVAGVSGRRALTRESRDGTLRARRAGMRQGSRRCAEVMTQAVHRRRERQSRDGTGRGWQADALAGRRESRRGDAMLTSGRRAGQRRSRDATSSGRGGSEARARWGAHTGAAG